MTFPSEVVMEYVAAATDAVSKGTASPPRVTSESEMGWLEEELPHHWPSDPVPGPPDIETV